jgi:alkylation response protein AidB-like acyl-CoA dehydrogenase
MDLLPSAEQEQIVAATVAFLTSELPVERLREPRAGADAAKVWTKLAELGWFALGGPASGDDGFGLTLTDAALVYRELGRHLVPPAALGAALGASVAAAAGDRALAAEIGEGRARVGLAVRPSEHAGVGALSSGPFLLLDVDDAELFLAWNEREAALIAASDLGPVERKESVDPGLAIAEARVTGERLTAAVRADALPVDRWASVLTAAMLVGIAEATRDLSVAHAKTREQFGRPIGSFQAVKHACADMAVRAEAAAPQVWMAALTADAARPDADFQAAAAKLVATEAAYANSRAAVQVHGGMGVTFECLVHFHLKRTHVLDAVGGNVRDQQARVLVAGR